MSGSWVAVTSKLLIRHDKLEVHSQISKESTAALHNDQAGCYIQIVRRCCASVAGTSDKVSVTSNSKRHTGTTKGSHSLPFTSTVLVTTLLVQRIRNSGQSQKTRMVHPLGYQSLNHSLELLGQRNSLSVCCSASRQL